MCRAGYCFFDAAFLLETDSPEFLAEFDRHYGRFRAHPPPGAPLYRVHLAGRPECALDGEPVRCADAEAMRLYAHNALLNAVSARVSSHFLFHAAALRTPAGAGLILAGGAGLGKTTLALALVERGYGFLSDDVAAVGRADRLLYPFPRAVGLRVPGAGAGQKQALDPVEVAPPAPARCLVVLSDGAAGPPGQGPWYAVIDRLPAALLDDLRRLPSLDGLEPARAEPYPALRLWIRPGAGLDVEPQLAAACARHGALLFEVVRGREAPPDFSAEPRLEPLAPLEAARLLLRHLKGGPRSALLRQGFGGGAPALFLALIDLAGTMDCFRLTVGRLEAMLDIIAGLTGLADPSGLTRKPPCAD